MKYDVLIMPEAYAALSENAVGWAENRSRDEAIRRQSFNRYAIGVRADTDLGERMVFGVKRAARWACG